MAVSSRLPVTRRFSRCFSFRSVVSMRFFTEKFTSLIAVIRSILNGLLIHLDMKQISLLLERFV